MTEKRNYTVNTLIKHDNLRIPSREEFHRYASNTISIGDFETDHCNGYQISKVASALKWTINGNKKNDKKG